MSRGVVLGKVAVTLPKTAPVDAESGATVRPRPPAAIVRTDMVALDDTGRPQHNPRSAKMK